jgi:hypothetical protein
MAITYTWEVTEIHTANTTDLQSIVVQTRWKKIGTDENGNTGFFPGATPFKPDSVDPAKFVPFTQLTEEVVLGWIQSVVTGHYEQHVNERIAEEITKKASPVSEQRLPWAPEKPLASEDIAPPPGVEPSSAP